MTPRTTLTRDVCLRPARRRRRRGALAVLALTAALGTAACGGNSSSGSPAAGSPAAGSPAAGSPAAGSPAAATPASSSTPATVKAAKLPGYNSVLTTSSGQAVYLLTSDPAGGSHCTGACASQWPPLLEKGGLHAGPGVQASRLSAFKRSDGREQVMYNHHALYTHAGTGVTSGAGLASDGGIWYLVSPSGNAVKSTSSGGY